MGRFSPETMLISVKRTENANPEQHPCTPDAMLYSATIDRKPHPRVSPFSREPVLISVITTQNANPERHTCAPDIMLCSLILVVTEASPLRRNGAVLGGNEFLSLSTVSWSRCCIWVCISCIGVVKTRQTIGFHRTTLEPQTR